MSSRNKLIQGSEEDALALFDLSSGVSWVKVAECLRIDIDPDKAIREKQRRYVNGWIARKFGRGDKKSVYAVWSRTLSQWVYKRLEVMDEDELTQVLAVENKSLGRASKRKKAIKYRIAEIQTMLKIKPFDFESGEQEIRKPA